MLYSVQLLLNVNDNCCVKDKGSDQWAATCSTRLNHWGNNIVQSGAHVKPGSVSDYEDDFSAQAEKITTPQADERK